MFTNEQAQVIAEAIYQSWKWGDTSLEPNDWFMVKMDQDIQELCHQRLDEENLKTYGDS